MDIPNDTYPRKRIEEAVQIYMTEHLYPMDEVLFNGKYWLVSNACWIDTNGEQVVSLIRMADIDSNRPRRESIMVRADECKIIREVGLEMWKEQYGDLK